MYRAHLTNNSFSTPSFNQKRGVHQGDPLSPSLSIIVLELLAISVSNNDQISCIVVDVKELKLVIFADDMTNHLSLTNSHTSPYSSSFSAHTRACV